MNAIRIFRLPDGRSPYLEWLEGLDFGIQFRILAYVDRVRRGGCKKSIKPVGGQVFEIKIDTGPGYRVYFGRVFRSRGCEMVLLLYGGAKGSQTRDIRRAQAIGGFLMNRNEDYDEWQSQQLLKKPKKIKYFIYALMDGDDGLTLEDALRRTIYCIGVKEFAQLAKVQPTHVTAFLKGVRSPKPQTLNTYLAPFGLRIRYELEEVA